jgi:hypothetical protein
LEFEKQWAISFCLSMMTFWRSPSCSKVI